MTQRLVEIVVPEADGATAIELLAGHPVLGEWRNADGARVLLRALLPAQGAEPVLDALQKRFSGVEGFAVVLLPVEAAMPRAEDSGLPAPPVGHRVSRDELYAEAEGSIRTSPIFIAMTMLSAVVAAVGLLRNNLAVVIGAMMIAPLLSPNVTLALGTTLGDARLIRDALKANLIGVSIALSISVAVGASVPVDASVPEIALRTAVSPVDLILALAAGAAGTLAFTTGLPSAVIGVMVAVALLPPLVTLGLLLGSGQLIPASGAFLLLVGNVVCVNLAGIVTFLLQGIRPMNWWEAERARRSTRLAMVLWAVTLAILALVLLVSNP